jgi:DNA excision repair protein ERCC-4
MEHDRFFVGPTEPLELRALGETSSLPEVHGCDVAWTGPNGLVGVQRKTIPDLVESLRDGRLAESAARMRLLDVRVLLVEGRPRWSYNGFLLDVRTSISRDSLRGLLWSAQQRGIWVMTTATLVESIDAIVHLRTWLAKRRHVSFERRPGDAAAVGSRAWGVHLLQSFPLVGPVVAGAVWDHFGAVPLRWSCTADDLAGVRGIGPARAHQLLLALPARADDEAAA